MFTSAKDLIERKTSIEKRLNDTMAVSIEGLGEWQFKVPSSAEILDAQEYQRAHGHAGDNTGDYFLVYNQCEAPNLRDEALQEAYGVHGAAILEKFLMAGEVDTLAKALMRKAGYGGGTIDIIAKGADEVKND